MGAAAASIGIIANPVSARDIRRVIANANNCRSPTGSTSCCGCCAAPGAAASTGRW